MTSLLEQVLEPNVTRNLLNDVTSAVLAYCIAASFLVKSRQQQVMPSHFMRMLSYLDQPTVTFTNIETSSETFDLIHLSANLSPEVREYIRDNLMDRSYPEFSIVRSVLKYINNDRHFQALVQSVTNNGIENEVSIDVEDANALAGQGTSIRIDNVTVNILEKFTPMVNSMPTSTGIGRRELETDYGYDAQRRFIRNHLGIDLGHDSALYYQMCDNNGSPTSDSIEDATRDLYNRVCDKLNQGFNGALNSPTEDFKATTVDCLMNQCLGVDSVATGTCLQVNTGKVGYSSFRPENVFAGLYNRNIKASCKSKSQGNPCLMITDVDSGECLFKTRFKKESYPENPTGHRYKLYFEPNKTIIK